MISIYLWLLAATTALSAAAPLLEDRADTYPCTNGVFVLAARGTDSTSKDPNATDPNYRKIGNLTKVANAVIDEAGDGSYLRALPYAASPGVNYFASIDHGVDVAQGIITDYVDRCKTVGNKNPRIVLLGYSQGGQVMTATLIGTLGKPNLDAYKQYITGGAFFASPSFRAGVEPIDAGNATTDGTFARSAADYKYFNDNYGNRIRNYCQAGDEFCANGGVSEEAQAIHHASVNVYMGKAEKFLRTLV